VTFRKAKRDRLTGTSGDANDSGLGRVVRIVSWSRCEAGQRSKIDDGAFANASSTTASFCELLLLLKHDLGERSIDDQSSLRVDRENLVELLQRSIANRE